VSANPLAKEVGLDTGDLSRRVDFGGTSEQKGVLMRRLSVIILAVVAFVAVGVIPAVADSENAALIISLDEGCFGGVDELSTEGSVHYVEAENGKWKLTCQGTFTGGSIGSALILRSTAENPIDGCFTPFGFTLDWTQKFSPSGNWSISCHGDLTP
jgi:hypothetical protein